MITQLSGTGDLYNDISQWQTDDGAVYQTIRFGASLDENGQSVAIQAGRMTLNYNAVNLATGAAADRVKMVRWKIVNGVASVAIKGNVFTNNDSGMNGVDVDVIAQGGEIIVTLTGNNNQNIRHTLHIIKLSSALNY